MTKFQESHAKQTIRLILKRACQLLQRPGLTYLGLPAERALDIISLDGLIDNVICIDDKESVLEETRRSIAALRLKKRLFFRMDMWDYLQKKYAAEQLVADVTFLDFYGGGISKGDPFATEIAGLRSYFAKQANYPNQAFVLAWTYMPRDKGIQPYKNALHKIVSNEDLKLLENTSSMHARSLAIRLLLRQSINEHNMTVKLYHHTIYKNVMNTIILLYSKGLDPQCKLELKSPDSLVSEPCWVYTPGRATPRIESLLPG
jgi:hypothetical protein